MRVFRDGTEYQGSPADIAELWSYEHNAINYDTEPTTSYSAEDFSPLEAIVGESKSVREKLAEDPNYNPFGGVVPSKESEQDVQTNKTPYNGLPDASVDTGVDLK